MTIEVLSGIDSEPDKENSEGQDRNDEINGSDCHDKGVDGAEYSNKNTITEVQNNDKEE